jgi:glycosyltransferase involved in cell wall biosynthesis
MASERTIDVLHVIGSLTAGGAERNLCYLAPWMAESKFSYGVCCLTNRGEYAHEIECIGVPVFELGHRTRYTISTILRLRRLLKRRRVKVIHTHLFESGVIGRLAAWLAGVPVVITHEHGKTVWKRWYQRGFEALAMFGTDLRIAVSDDIRAIRMKRELTPGSKIVVVGNAVEPLGYGLGDAVREAKRTELGLAGCFVIGTVGRLVTAKSYDLLLRAAEEVCGRRPEVRFIVVGEGPLRKSLTDLREALHLTDKVFFLGSRTDIPELLAAIDLYIITSQREGLPISLIEAMMAGKPVVATRVGGIPEAVRHNVEGMLVCPGERDGLVHAILGLMDDEAGMRVLGQRARARAIEKYSARAILETLEGIYASLLARKGIDVPATRGS